MVLLRRKLLKGMVIPAHPLALTAARQLDERRQRALTRYYVAAGAGGVAVGVHTTQFEIRDPGAGLYEPVLGLAMEELRRTDMVRVAGIIGKTPQAIKEAAFAAGCGYDAGLLSLGALRDASTAELLDHVRAVAEIIPVFGFYLQPAAGGRILPYDFWRGFAEIDNVVAVKVAPFNRYQTLDVARAVAESGRAHEIAVYTGNDDNIVIDLLTTYRFGDQPLPRGNPRSIVAETSAPAPRESAGTGVSAETVRIVGGLLGHWAVWTLRAVRLLERVHEDVRVERPLSHSWLSLANEITDSNAAFFDAANQFHGCIAGIHEVLRRQGLLEGRWCLNPKEELSPGQMEEIDRVYRAYPHLNDDSFVRQHLEEWLK